MPDIFPLNTDLFTDLPTLALYISPLLAFAIQLFLCHKVKNLFIRLILPLIFAATTLLLFAAAVTSTDWLAFGYMAQAFFALLHLLACGAACLIRHFFIH